MIEPAGAPALGAPDIASTLRASRFCACAPVEADSPEDGSASRAMLRREAGTPLFEIAAAAATAAADEGGMPPLELTAGLLEELLLLLFSPSDKPVEEGTW